ncbi:MAG: TIGR00266 family protein [Candidatus Aenigmarchaeota archaeon]|nr:TIGR00266 family protein [Candidatus Aenigmarchaeota archaeon]NIP40847.1 TIGR00266 family protein [Candidatus Aenigmarchaeota archaeon]NIQ17961.1 TIGR00266 family protein [Candidatus Aenigmarchaeota archaeon]NIS73550.1 TIGR00266 family protein [Candidatus Aenigmarchaeota archaeon]
MKYDLQGTTMQILNVQLDEKETIVSESGRLIFMSDNVKMDTKMKGGFWSAIKRKFAGESFFLVNFSSLKGNGVVSFGSEFPGKIIPLRLKEGEQLIAQKDAFLCSEGSVTFDATWTRKIGAGLLGGEGLILIKIKGPGIAFFNVGGEVTKIDLAKGQKIRVDTGNLAMFDSEVSYSVERVKGIKNLIWGGEGLFLATCEGPGRVWVQSLPVSELAGKLAEYLPNHRGGGSLAAGMLIGGMMKR